MAHKTAAQEHWKGQHLENGGNKGLTRRWSGNEHTPNTVQQKSAKRVES